MKNLIMSIFFSLLPIYSFITWITTFSNKLISNHSERLIEYRKIMFNFKWDFKILNLLNLILIIFSVGLLTKYFIVNDSILKRVGLLTFIFLLVIIFIFNLWGLL